MSHIIDPNGVYTTDEVAKMFHSDWTTVCKNLNLRDRIFGKVVFGSEILDAIKLVTKVKSEPRSISENLTILKPARKTTKPAQHQRIDVNKWK